MITLQREEVLDDIKITDNYQAQLVDKDLLRREINLNEKLFNILHMNIRSANKNYDNLILLLETFSIQYNDIIVLSETFRLPSIDHFNIPGYNTFYNEADYNKNDGVIILVKSYISANFRTFTLPNSRATVGRIECSVSGNKVGVTAVYKPPPIPKQEFTSDITEYLESAAKEQIEIFIGDINIDLMNSENNEVTNYMTAMAQQGYISYVNSITRFDSKTCLDHLFVRCRQGFGGLHFRSFVLDSHLTDHGPIMLNISCTHSTSNNNNADVISVSRNRYDVDKLKMMLRCQDWSSVTTDLDPETATSTFVNIYKSLLDLSKIKNNEIHKQYRKLKNWITNGIIRSIRHRDKLKRRLLKQYNLDLEIEYKRYRNILNKIITKQKNNYYKNEISRNNKDLKKIYDLIKDATNEKKTNKVNITINRDNGDGFLTDKDMSNYCNDYFINVGVEMEKRIPVVNDPCPLDDPVSDSLYLSPVTDKDLIRNISTLKNNSAPGYDRITPVIIKHTHTEILTPLTYIINLIFQTGIVPSEFKISMVTPVHKNGDRTSIGNFRPISLITCFAKILERCVKDRLIDFFKKNNILSENQFGFVQGGNTTNALYEFTTQISGCLNDSKKCIAVFIDLAKAFDTVPHDRLLEVLAQYGVRGPVLRLIRSYLTDRTQVVKINNSISDKRIIKIGVPQGTVLGPLLFIAYINALLKLDTGGTMISYADDTVLIFKDDDWDGVREKVVSGFSKVRNWLETYKLSLNLTKTNYIAFSLTAANRPNFSSIQINNNSEINEVSNTKYLGVVVDQFLKWQPHINYLSVRLRKLIHKFYIIRNILDTKLLILIYKSLVESLIGYGILVWGGLYESALYGLNVVQRCILKIIYKKHRIYPTALLFTQETCNIRTMYLTTICTFLHIRKERNKFVNHTHKTRSRENKNLMLPRNNNNINLKCINYLGPRSYNLLPNSVRLAKSSKKFRELCKAYIFDNFRIFESLFD